ncbi:hypothetical protein HKK80_06025 [Halonotius sp. F2-221B]|uniref:hypothetical protein n=1 Tax=Halonotius sp. F2-221B TaxID=2731620 RepID=UPI00398A5116
MSTPHRTCRREYRQRVDGGTPFSSDRHRALRAVIDALRRHPVVTAARGQPPSTFTEVSATLAPHRWGYHAADATLRVTWQPLAPPEFAFHYSEDSFDCGWHREPNPHVDGDAHYQERVGTDEYRYEPIRFDGETAPELTWEVMERLRKRLDGR